MKFGAWTYDMSKVNLTFYRDIKKFDLKSYVKSNEWNIIGNSASRNTEKYGRIKSICQLISDRFLLCSIDCCPEIYVDLKFYLHLERQGGFYNYILILPCVLLSCLTCILFWLPVCIFSVEIKKKHFFLYSFSVFFKPESPSKLVLGKDKKFN